MLLAKSNGITIKDHSNVVALRCKELASQMLQGNELKHLIGPQYTSEDVIKACYYAGLLHDIGKAVPYFQEYIINHSEPVSTEDDLVDMVADTEAVTRYHNEFSWAAVCTYEEEIKAAIGLSDRKCWEAVKYAIFWHHAAAADFSEIKGRDIFFAKEFDLGAIIACLSDMLGQDFQLKEPVARDLPDFFAIDPMPYEDNALIMFVRAVLIRADREVSGYAKPTKEFLNPIQHIACPWGFDLARYQTQLDIVNRANEITTVVAAPAGFGKTLIGLVWALRFTETVYWVCPRNEVIDSVYQSLAALKTVLGVDINIEKMYTGLVQASDKALVKNQPRIVVTNIDAISSPLASNRQANLQYDMMVKPMIFDEFHEFPADNCPMYAAYNLLMEVRNDFTCAHSLLVSATPYTQYKEDSFRNPVNHLPKRNGHYAPQHNKPYGVSIIKSVPKPAMDTALVFNVVKSAQEAAQSEPLAYCFHSKFTDEDKNMIREHIYRMYGKGAVAEKYPVVSGPIMRASMDISFRHIVIFVSSPFSDMQIIGRCCRWGEFDDSTITFVIPDKLSAADRTYLDHNDFPKSHLIYHKWVECLKANVKELMTLTDLYDVYDQFNRVNAELISEYQRYLHKKGIEQLVKQCYPHRPAYFKNPKNRGNKGSLRNTDPSIYFIVKNKEGQYVGPFQIGESVTDFSDLSVAKEAFKPYYASDRTELLHIIEGDSEFVTHYPELVKYLTNFGGKKGERRALYYGTSTSMWRNPAYPFVVRPSHMTYDSTLGYQFCKDIDTDKK